MSTWAEEYANLRKSWGYFNLGQAEEVFRLGGEDPAAFLNNYNTQDILGMETPGIAPGAFLTQKGKLISDTLILKHPKKLFLIFHRGYGQRVQDHLKIYIDLADVEMENVSDDFTHLVLLGHSIPDKIQEGLDPHTPKSQVRPFDWEGLSGWTWVTDRFGCPNLELLLPNPSAQDWKVNLEKNGGRPLSPQTLEVLRVEAGFPKMGVDMDGNNLVAEVGLDKRATSFTKGCYLGQEPTARIDTQGHVNRKLYQLQLEKPMEGPVPLEIFQGDQVVGHLTSAIPSPKFGGTLALGTLKTKALDSSDPLEITMDDQRQRLHILEENN